MRFITVASLFAAIVLAGSAIAQDVCSLLRLLDLTDSIPIRLLRMSLRLRHAHLAEVDAGPGHSMKVPTSNSALQGVEEVVTLDTDPGPLKRT